MSYVRFRTDYVVPQRAACALAVAGVALLVTACGGSDNASPKTVYVTAPTTTVGQAASATKAAPSLTLETFPFTDQSGKIYEGVTAIRKAHELRAEKYVDMNQGIGGNNELGNAVLQDLTQQMNEWIRSGANKQTADGYKDFTSPDGKQGMKAIAEQFYDPAYEKALSSSSAFNEFIVKYHQDYIDLYDMVSHATSTNYEAGFKSVLTTYIAADGALQIDTVLSYTDNVPGQQRYNPSAVRISLQQTPGADGRPVWKVIDLSGAPHA